MFLFSFLERRTQWEHLLPFVAPRASRSNLIVFKRNLTFYSGMELNTTIFFLEFAAVVAWTHYYLMSQQFVSARRSYVLRNSCHAATMLLTFIHLNSNGIITCVKCIISFLFENGRFFKIQLVPQLYLNIKHLRASCLEYLLDLSKYTLIN